MCTIRGMYLKHKPGVYYCTNDKYINDASIEFLLEAASEDELPLARLCLHPNHESHLMSMLLVVKNFYTYPPHKHDWKDESYTILRGSCLYEEYNHERAVTCRHFLPEKSSFFNSRRTFHTLIPQTDVLAFLEHTVGPFSSQKPIFL